MCSLQVEPAVEFRNRLRAGRATALADSEGYVELLHAIEELGAFVTCAANAHGLGAYHAHLVALVRPSLQDSFSQLLVALRKARNDAAHLGAAARRVTLQAIDVAIILEESLMTNVGAKAEHYMVEGAVCAEGWHTIAMIRRTMLRSQFSALPYRKNDQWFLVTDSAVVRFLAKGGSTTDQLASAKELDLVTPVVVVPNHSVDTLRRSDSGLVLVVESDRLHGVIAPFDLL